MVRWIRRLKIVFCSVLFFQSVVSSPLEAAAETPAGMPKITADAAIVIEASTGRVVYEKNADAQEYPASMTKMMTCLLALEENKPGKLALISANAANVEDSPLGLAEGDRLDFWDLLTGMMLVSDNSAAVAVGENTASSLDAFVEQMNEKAKAIGAYHTHFVNPNGLPNPKHYSTARDMSKIAAYAWKNPEFRKIVGKKMQRIYWQSPREKWVDAENTNELLGAYPGMNGMKTGWTEEAGGCLAASAERNGVQLIAIVMHAESTEARFQDAAELLDYGFSRVAQKKGLTRQEAQKTVWVRGGQNYEITARPAADVLFPLLDGEDGSRYSVRYAMRRAVAAPIVSGQKVGELVLCYDGKEVERVDMLADSAIGKGFSLLSFFVGIYDGITGFFWG